MSTRTTKLCTAKARWSAKWAAAYWGDKIANLRALYAYMWLWPGKKTLFMGDEIAQGHEWRYDESLEWSLLQYAEHEGVRDVVRDVANLYKNDASLAQNDFNPDGFQWINADDGNNSVFTFLRFDADGKTSYAVASNFTPIRRENYPIGLPFAGEWREVLNTDAKCYGGRGFGNNGFVVAGDTGLQRQAVRRVNHASADVHNNFQTRRIGECAEPARGNAKRVRRNGGRVFLRSLFVRSIFRTRGSRTAAAFRRL